MMMTLLLLVRHGAGVNGLNFNSSGMVSVIKMNCSMQFWTISINVVSESAGLGYQKQNILYRYTIHSKYMGFQQGSRLENSGTLGIHPVLRVPYLLRMITLVPFG